MHKKIKTVLTVVLCILSITALCFALTACVTHKHTAADAWQSDASGHWHECTANDGAKLDEAQHDFEWVDVTPATCLAKGTQVQKCKTCNFEGESREVDKADHQLEVKHNDSKHWQECSVCHEKFNEADHNVTSEWKKDETGHWHGCTGCDIVTDFAEHELEINADKTAFECKECGYSEEHTHSYTYAYDGPAGHHGICEECGDTTAVVAHRNGDSNGKCIDDGNTHYYMCADCERKVSASHTYGEYLDDGEGSHYRKCNDCDNEMDHVAHTASEVIGSAGVAGHTAKCETCQIEYIAAHDLHTVSDEAEGHHSKCSACEYSTETVSHSLLWKGLSAGHYQYCEGCSYQTQQENHQWKYVYDEDQHWQQCTVCLYDGSKSDHRTANGSNDEEHYVYCYNCNYIIESTREAHDVDYSVWATYFQTANQSTYHYNPCSGCARKINEHKWQLTLNDGWYEGEGNCEFPTCTFSVYEFDAATGTITGYTGDFAKIRIPSQIGGVTVTTLGLASATSNTGAFYQATFTNVEIPSTVTTINGHAFRNTKLVEIVVPKTVTSIGSAAFRENTDLIKAEVNVLNNTQIFYGCSALQEVICGEGVTSIQNTVFYNCTALKKIVFESTSTPTVSGSNTFKNVTGLTVYYKFSKEVYEESKISDAVLQGATKKFYYEERPSTKGGETDVLDSEAWHYNGKGEIELWSESDD